MDNQDIRTLKILEEIDHGDAPSQRDLSKKLNISLGLVNSFIKRLTNKGYFKITNIPKNRARYILTPKGAAEKTRLTYEYIQYSFQFYKDARQRMRELFRELQSRGIRRVVFYGKSELAEIAYVSLQETSVKLVAVVDDLKVGEKFMGTRAATTDLIASAYYDKIIITHLTDNESIFNKILKMGVPGDKVAGFK